MQQKIPFDTGKIKIGIAYQPSLKQHYNSDQDWIQAALLGIEKNPWEDRFFMYEYFGFVVAVYFLFSLLSRSWYGR